MAANEAVKQIGLKGEMKMDIPRYDEMFQVVLKTAEKGDTHKKSAFTPLLARHFNLSDEMVAAEYPSGNAMIFADRISWTLSYLALSNLLERPKRGYYIINDLGKQFAQKSNEEINAYVKQQMLLRQQEKNAQHLSDGLTAAPVEYLSEQVTPLEQLNQGYAQIREETYNEILDTILSKTPTAFEHLVVALLQKMGYGGAVEKAGRVTRASGDGGIDGEIKEDVLGLGRIHIQAKRHQRDAVIGRPEIQNFAGALMGSRANKGVFITTARFSAQAVEFAENLSNARLVLIDGMKLAEYIYQYDFGMQTEQVFSIKKLDADYWDNLADEAV